MTSSPKIIFVLGPPGVGKGTQCMLLTQLSSPHRHIHHISIGDILRSELQKPSSKWASIIRANMAEGRTGPPEMSVSMLQEAIARRSEDIEPGKEMVFLVDGFPRSLNPIALFESTICAPSLVLSLNCPLEILQERLLSRAKSSSRIDDGVEIMHKRFGQHVSATGPVIEHYRERGLLAEIDASRNVEEVHGDIWEAVKKTLGEC
ncbi:uncharacterized protein EAF01_010323 [Botrytis porri]|uniref:Uncharacterized protein n=1 Tax=Botrytis porri TaxID=87229 RepID=A0A4Z1L5S0_9HELO|nr:uncharacterized protein EAF01_010323 [Botrytis porri]KAF7892243.1 hypothetical protein EAF01_010323 [Botrytis porri]TGO92016.1 hypothetical protein BPOR_0012g00150 [Botrytis porri]